MFADDGFIPKKIEIIGKKYLQFRKKHGIIMCNDSGTESKNPIERKEGTVFNGQY